MSSVKEILIRGYLHFSSWKQILSKKKKSLFWNYITVKQTSSSLFDLKWSTQALKSLQPL